MEFPGFLAIPSPLNSQNSVPELPLALTLTPHTLTPEPNRTQTDLLKIQSNRTELEPEKFGSIRSLIYMRF
jgi:hypothetical protein